MMILDAQGRPLRDSDPPRPAPRIQRRRAGWHGQWREGPHRSGDLNDFYLEPPPGPKPAAAEALIYSPPSPSSRRINRETAALSALSPILRAGITC